MFFHFPNRCPCDPCKVICGGDVFCLVTHELADLERRKQNHVLLLRMDPIRTEEWVCDSCRAELWELWYVEFHWNPTYLLSLIMIPKASKYHYQMSFFLLEIYVFSLTLNWVQSQHDLSACAHSIFWSSLNCLQLLIDACTCFCTCRNLPCTLSFHCGDQQTMRQTIKSM